MHIHTVLKNIKSQSLTHPKEICTHTIDTQKHVHTEWYRVVTAKHCKEAKCVFSLSKEKGEFLKRDNPGFL